MIRPGLGGAAKVVGDLITVTNRSLEKGTYMWIWFDELPSFNHWFTKTKKKAKLYEWSNKLDQMYLT